MFIVINKAKMQVYNLELFNVKLLYFIYILILLLLRKLYYINYYKVYVLFKIVTLL